MLVPVLGGDVALELGRDVLRLTRQPTGSGARYSDGKVTVWNKGREASLDVGGLTYRCTESRAGSIRADARLRGVDFRATGNEARLGARGAPGPDRVPRPGRGAPDGAASGAAGRPESGETVYAAEIDGHRLRVLIRERECVDSMSGERAESSVAVEMDGQRVPRLRLRPAVKVSLRVAIVTLVVGLLAVTAGALAPVPELLAWQAPGRLTQRWGRSRRVYARPSEAVPLTTSMCWSGGGCV